MPQARIRNIGITLRIAFGGLLLLMTATGLNALRSIQATQAQHTRIQNAFVLRSRQLNRIRAELFLAGTNMRDFLLEPDAARAATYRDELTRVYKAVGNDLTTYKNQLETGDPAPVSKLQARLDDFWTMLTPAFSWDVETRRARGYVFARDEVRPRREAMLALADQIANLNEEQLRAGTDREEAVFGQARTELLLALGATLAAGSLLAFFSNRRIMALEERAAEHLSEVEQARVELRALSARLVAVQEQERRSIARELHDEVGQSLSAILVGLSNLAAAAPGDAKRHVDTVRKITEGSVAAVRNMALLLRPSMLDDLGLVPALQWQAREISRRTELLVDVVTDNVSDDLAEEYRTCVYRVVQEALHNVAKHASAKTVKVEVKAVGDRLLVRVRDDGQGFEPRLHRGLGLLGMEERVTNLGGKIMINSVAGKGTLLAIEIPLAGASLQEQR